MTLYPISVEEVPSCFVQGEVVVLSVLLLQEMMVKLKRRIERMMSRCFTEFPISGLGLPKLYHNSGVFYKKLGGFRKYSLVILDVSETLF